MADWVQGEQLYCYDLQTGGYVRSLTLSPAPSLQQGIFCQDGCMLVSCDDGDADAGSFDNIYSVDLETGEVSLFRTMDDFILTGEIEGLTVNPLNGNLVVLSNRGARIVLGMPKGFYEGYDREIHNLYLYTKN
jgi:outer membrane protein assembly factor BamB